MSPPCTPPSRERFTAAEQRIIADHRTPYQVQQFLYGLPYNTRPTLRSLRGVIATGQAHCLEGALSAAVILEQHSYPALLLDLESQDDLDHVLFLFRQGDCWGTVGKSRDPGLHGRKPVFRSLRALVDSYADPFVDLTGRITGFGVSRLEGLERYDWRLSKRNVWKVERHLIDMPHQSFHTTDRRYHHWHQRYIRYRERYPHRKPTYYTDRRTWIPGYPKGV